MKLYTTSGDDGSTGLFGGPRVPKCNPRVSAYGEVDEANAAIGLAIAECADAQIKDRLLDIQSDLFVVGAELATPQGARPPSALAQGRVQQLEDWIDQAGAETIPLRNFVLPGGTKLAATLHLTRTTCRRAERAVVALAQQEQVGETVVVYLNRLSDLLFAWARLANHRAKIADLAWNPPET